MDLDHPVHVAFMNLQKELDKLPMNDYNLYLQAAKIKSFTRFLEERLEELNQLIVAEMEEKKEEKKEYEFGKFTLAERSKWKYSENIKPLEDAVKVAKKQEEEAGIAQKEITKYLIVK